MKVVTVCAAACSGATVARTARTASANTTGIRARGHGDEQQSREGWDPGCLPGEPSPVCRGVRGETAVRAGLVIRRSGRSAVPISVVFDSIVPPKPGSSKASPAGFWKLIA